MNVLIGKEAICLNNKTIYFSVCRYIPDILRGESINIGIVVHIPESGLLSFRKTRNFSRIRSFDDEIELDMIKAVLESLEYQFNTNRSSEIPLIDSEDFLKQELQYFVNQIQFSEIRVLISEDNKFEEDINDLTDMYLYYDKKKSERIDRNRVRSLASKMVTQSNLKNYINRKPEIKNMFKQDTFDFSIDMNDNKTYIKALTFDYKNSNKFFNEIKSFLYDVNYFQHTHNVKVKVVINNTNRDEQYEQIAYDILKKEVDVLTLEEFDKFVRETSSLDEGQLSLFQNQH